MPDDPLLARIEERVEQLAKRLDRHESAVERDIENLRLGMREQFVSLEKLLRESMTSAIGAIEAKNVIVRTIVLTMCGAVLLGFLNWIIAPAWGTRPNVLPQLPPAHSSREQRQ